MAIGYLVTLGDGVLDSGDSISASQSNFDETTSTVIGTGSWQWTGVWDQDGQTYSNACEAESARVEIRHTGEC